MASVVLRWSPRLGEGEGWHRGAQVAGGVLILSLLPWQREAVGKSKPSLAFVLVKQTPLLTSVSTIWQMCHDCF